MKTLAFACALVGASLAFAANENEDYGGVVTVWPKDHGTFLFVDCQSAVPDAVVAKPIDALLREFNIDIRKVAGSTDPIDVRKIPAELKGLGANGGIWIVNDSALPATLAATEDGWGVLNVAQLIADSPAPEKLEKRMFKFVNRLFANLNGIGDSTMMPACVMKQAVGVAGVDALVCATYSPEANSKVAGYLAKAGYKKRRTGYYYDACEQGWAPAPTNDVQKKIWDEVHQMPTKPIKILPPSKQKK